MISNDKQDHKAARRVCFNYLARREYSHYELQQKLQQKEFSPDCIAAVLQALQVENLQSDQRFCESYIRYRANKGFGPVRIKQELSQRGVSHEIIAAGFAVFAGDWCELCLEALVKQIANASLADQKIRQKALRFLQYRGYEFASINNAMQEL